jgi:type IV secretion system protein TrbL
LRRKGLSAAVLAVVGLFTAGFAMPDAVYAQAKDDDCQALDTGPIPNPAQAACDVGEAVIDKGPVSAAQDAIAAPVKAAGDEVMKGITNWVGNGASWLVGQAGKLIDETTTPRIESPWFLRQYGTMGALAAVFALPLLLLSVLQSLMRRDAGQLTRSAFVHLPLAFAFTAAAVTVVQLALQLTDAMSAQVASSVGSDAKEFFKDTGKSIATVLAATGGNPVPLFAVFLGALVAAAGAFFVWLELLVRSAAIYVAVLFLPFTFVAMIWPQTAIWCRKLIDVLIAVIAAKFVIVAIMSLAAAGLGQSRGDDAFQGVLAGAALMLLAAFSPFALLKLLPFAEAAIANAASARGALSHSLPGGSVMTPAMAMRMAMDRNNGGGGGALRAAPAGAGAGGGARSAGAGAVGAAGAPLAAGAAGLSAAQAVGGTARSRGEGIGRYGDLASQPEAAEGLRYAGNGAGDSAPRTPGSSVGRDGQARGSAAAGRAPRPPAQGRPPVSGGDAPGAPGASGDAGSADPPPRPPRPRGEG